VLSVTVQVPEERLAEFYLWFGRWLGGATEMAPDPYPNTLEPWVQGDADLAGAYWKKLSVPARKLLSVLIDSPGTKVAADRLAREAGIAKGQFGVAGTLAWPGRHAYAMGRALPVEWEETGEGFSNYWMPETVATLFRRARADESR
jgi:hypothetical protein